MENSSFDNILNKMGENYISTLKKIFDYKGRANKFEYWSFNFINFIISFILGLLATFGTFNETFNIMIYTISIIFAIVIIFPNIALLVRRLHDRNRSGKILWLGLLLFVGMIAMSIIYSFMHYKNAAYPTAGMTVITLLFTIGLLAFSLYIFIMPILPSKEDNKYGKKIEQTRAETITANALIVAYYLIEIIYVVFAITNNPNYSNLTTSSQINNTKRIESNINNYNKSEDTNNIQETETSLKPEIPMNSPMK